MKNKNRISLAKAINITICIGLVVVLSKIETKASDWKIDDFNNNYFMDYYYGNDEEYYYDYEAKTENYNNYIKEKIKKSTTKDFLKFSPNNYIDEIIYKEEPLNNELETTISGKITLEKPENSKNTAYYIPLRSLEKANDKKIGFVINFEGVELLLSNNFINTKINREAIEAKNAVKNSSLKDLYVRIIFNPQTIKNSIRGNVPTTSLIEFDVDLFGFENNINIFDREVSDYLKNELENNTALKDLDKITNILDNDFEVFVFETLDYNIWEEREVLNENLFIEIEELVLDNETGERLKNKLKKIVDSNVSKSLETLDKNISKEIVDRIRKSTEKNYGELRQVIYSIVGKETSKTKKRIIEEVYQETLSDIRNLGTDDEKKERYLTKGLESFLGRTLDDEFTDLENNISDKIFYNAKVEDYTKEVDNLVMYNDNNEYILNRLDNIANGVVKKYMSKIRKEFTRNLTEKAFQKKIKNFNSPVVITFENNYFNGEGVGYKLVNGTWYNLPVNNTNNISIATIYSPTTFIFASSEIYLNNFEYTNELQSDKVLKKYDLYTNFKDFNVIDGKKIISKNQLVTVFGNIVGYTGNNSLLELKSLGLEVPLGNLNGYAKQSEVIKLVMGIFELKTGTEIRNYQIRNFKNIENLKNTTKNNLKEYQVAIEVGILTKDEVDGNKQITVEELLNIISRLDSRVGGF